jgi:hypothetical protein
MILTKWKIVNGKWGNALKGLHFGHCPKLKSAFYFWVQAKNKKLLSLIRENLCLMLYPFNLCPQRPQCKIPLFP